MRIGRLNLRPGVCCLYPVALIWGVATAGMAQPVPTGRLSGVVDGVGVDIAIDCSGWNNQQRSVSSLGDDRGRSDGNGDGLLFTFSHFAPAAMTDATLAIADRTYQIGAGFRAPEGATRWFVGDTLATFDGPSGAAGGTLVSLALNCAEKSAEEGGYAGRVTGELAGIRVDLPLSCDTWDDPRTIQSTTPPGSDDRIELFVIRQTNAGSVTAEIGAKTYQMIAQGDRLAVTGDTVVFTDTMKRSGGGSYGVDLRFDCTNRDKAAAEPEETGSPGIAAIPIVMLPGQRFVVSLAALETGPGARVELRDDGPGAIDIVTLLDEDAIGLSAPGRPGLYRILFFPTDGPSPSAQMEILVR